MTGRAIRIFLVDGTPSGLRTAELGMSTIKSVVVPRVSLSEAMNRSELQKTGIYILIGADLNGLGQKKVYIGESDFVIDRLASHNRDSNKDFWEDAVVFVSKDQNLTKGHVRYLEARLISLAKSAKRTSVVNGTAPAEQNRLPEPDEAEMEEFINQVKLLLGSLGYDLFEPAPVMKQPSSPSNIATESYLIDFSYSGNGFDAICTVNLDAGTFTVNKGSKCRGDAAAALTPTYRDLRLQLIQNRVLEEDGAQSYKFTQDFSFSSITAAAQVVSGSTVNGRTAWKIKDKPDVTFAQWQDDLIRAKQKQTNHPENESNRDDEAPGNVAA